MCYNEVGDEFMEDKKKKRIILIVIAVVLILLLILFLFMRGKGLKPYVEEKGIKLSSAKDTYTLSVEPYFKDENGNVIDMDGITFKESICTYEFSDYTVSEPDENGYATYSYKVTATTPIEYVEEDKTYPYHKYTYLFVQPSLFDYYTGQIYSEKHVSVNNSINYYDMNNVTEDMAFTEVTWKDQTYKIGVRVESESKWDGIKKESNGDGTNTVRDTRHTTVTTYVYAPKDYDGLMVFFRKNGTTKQEFKNILERNRKYKELVNEYNETGEKSEELIKMEEENAKTYKLLDPRKEGDKEYKNDAFHVFRMNEITKK